MSFNNQWYHQKFTYWKVGEPDAYGGHFFSNPIIISGRLEERVEEVYNSSGELIKSNSVIWCDEDLIEGSYILSGEHTSVDPSNTTFLGRNAQVIVAVSRIWDVDGIDVERRYHL